MAVDNSTSLVEINLTANTLTYKYEVNDEDVGQNLDSSISFMKYLSLSQIAQSLKNNMQGENNKKFYQALVDCNYGIEIEYHELNTAKRAVFRISTNELKDVLNGKYDDQPTAEDWNDFSDALEQLDEYLDAEEVEEEIIGY